jgi:hypothetical protein
LFAATHPERTTALVTYGGFATLLGGDDYPWGWSRETLEQGLRTLELMWADAADALIFWAPSVAADPAVRQWWGRFLRMSASPAAAVALGWMNADIDIRPVLPTIHVPTLVLHRAGDAFVDPGGSRFVASRIPGARYVDLPGADHLPFWEHEEAILCEVEEFLTGVRPLPEPDRILATVLFTDIVGSTEQAAAAGDRRWRGLLESHNFVVRRELGRFHGRQVNTAGDGFLAVFDGPARAIRCAQAIGAGGRQEPAAVPVNGAGYLRSGGSVELAELLQACPDAAGAAAQRLGDVADRLVGVEAAHQLTVQLLGPLAAPTRMLTAVGVDLGVSVQPCLHVCRGATEPFSKRLDADTLGRCLPQPSILASAPPSQLAAISPPLASCCLGPLWSLGRAVDAHACGEAREQLLVIL